MKKLLMLFGIIMVLGVVKAHAVSDPDFIRSSATVISPISVSSGTTPAQIDAGSNLLAGRFVLVISNEGSDNIRCGFSASVTTTTNGFLVIPGSPFVVKLASTIPVFCIATGSVPINISLIQGKSI